MNDAESESGEVREGPAGGAIDPNNLRPPDVEPLVDATDYDVEYDDVARDLGGGSVGGGPRDDGEDAEGELEGDSGDGERHPPRPGEFLYERTERRPGDRPFDLEAALRSSELRLPGGGRPATGHPSGVRPGGDRAARRQALEDGARSISESTGRGESDADGPAGSRFRALLIDGLNRPREPDPENRTVKGVVYRVQSLASGQVSVIFHVNSEDADTALAFVHLRGKTVELTLNLP